LFIAMRGCGASQHPDFDVLTATCPFRTSLARIANEWTATVVIVLAGGRMRRAVAPGSGSVGHGHLG